MVMSFVSSQNSATSVEGAQSRQSKVPIDRVSLSCLTHVTLASVLSFLLCLYLEFVPFWVQAAELNDKVSSAFTILVKTTVDFCPQLMYILCLGNVSWGFLVSYIPWIVWRSSLF